MLSLIFKLLFRAICQGTTLLFGSTGEIITEKSGNLNLGIPGIMYIGGISGLTGAYFYNNSTKVINPVLAILIPMLCTILGALLTSLIYCFLTITLRANQNVTGLTITTFGVGVGNFLGGSLAKIAKASSPFVAVPKIAKLYQQSIVGQKGSEYLKVFLGYGFMVYLALAIAIVATIILKRTRVGLHLRAVGENAATADAAGINVNLYKYVATCVGGVIAGLGGLYFVLDYSSGVWSNGGFGDLGWLAVAIVIFSTWNPTTAIFGSYLFGGLYVLYNYISGIPMQMIPVMQSLPYIATIVVLIIVSVREKRESQPPQSLGLAYFREDR